jgi:hypothetical protein
MKTLIDIYFSRFNKVEFFPLLHRQTFEKLVSEGLHYRHYYFAVTLLCVCAIASRYSPNPGTPSTVSNSNYSPGWEWFSQVYPPSSSFASPASIYELQSYCVRFNISPSSSLSHNDMFAAYDLLSSGNFNAGSRLGHSWTWAAMCPRRGGSSSSANRHLPHRRE